MAGWWRVLLGNDRMVSAGGLVTRAAVIIGAGLVLGTLVAMARPWLGEGNAEDDVAALVRGEGRAAVAESELFARASRTPNIENLVAFLEVHALRAIDGGKGANPGRFQDVVLGTSVEEKDVEALVASPALEPDAALVAGAWHAAIHDTLAGERLDALVAAAARTPPAPFANRLLAQRARAAGELRSAAAFHDREGMSFPARSHDVDAGAELLMMLGEHDELARLLEDPRRAERVDARTRYMLALHRRDFAGALRVYPSVHRVGGTPGSITLALLAGMMWLLFAWRIARGHERPWARALMLAAAVVLGAACTVGVLITGDVQEVLLKMRPRGDIITNFFFFVLGVGLREEAWKLVAALPLLLALRSRGTRADALVVGAAVGIGFAAEENINYLAAHNVGGALARFLSANPFHMCMTGLVALAAWDFIKQPARRFEHFTQVFFGAVLVHGLYDFVISGAWAEDVGIFAMTAFFLLVRQFMSEVNTMRRGTPLLPAFVISVSTVIAASYVYACWLAGPSTALAIMVPALLSQAIMIYAFVHELDRL